MSESFVDLSYRGLALGKRIKLTQIRPATGYLEMPTPMPVGTTIGIATDDGVLLEAIVAEVHEQTGGSDGRAPGMLVKPNLSVEAQDTWWRKHVEMPADKAGNAKAAPPPDAEGKVTLKSSRMTGDTAIPELLDDGRDTGVMDAVDMEAAGDPADTLIADLPHDTDPSLGAMVRDTQPNMRMARDTVMTPPTGAMMTPATGPPAGEAEEKRTMAMDAVDLAALGLGTSSDQLPVVKPEDYVDDGANTGETSAAPEKPESTAGGKAKKKRKRR